MTHFIERGNARHADEWIIHKSPVNYADRLATYITDPSTIIAHCKRNFGGRSPSRSEVEKMIARYRRPRREPDCDIEVVIPEPVATPKPAPVDLEFTPPPPEPVDLFPVRLVKAVAEDFGITYADIVGPSRRKRFVHARAVIIFILRERNDECSDTTSHIWSFPQIGRLIGRGDHTSPINLWRQRDRLLAEVPAIAASYAKRKGFK